MIGPAWKLRPPRDPPVRAGVIHLEVPAGAGVYVLRACMRSREVPGRRQDAKLGYFTRVLLTGLYLLELIITDPLALSCRRRSLPAAVPVAVYPGAVHDQVLQDRVMWHVPWRCPSTRPRSGWRVQPR